MKKYMNVLEFSLISLIASSCINSSSKTEDSKQISKNLESLEIPVQGNVMMGPVKNADVKAYRVNPKTGAADKEQLISQTKTNNEGNYTLNLPQNEMVVIEASGGNYIEESSGNLVKVGANQTLRTIVPSVDKNEKMEIAINGLTDMAFQHFENKVKKGLNSNEFKNEVIKSNNTVAKVFDIKNIVETIPSNPEKGEIPKDEKGKYALIMASLSHAAELSGVDSHAMVRAYAKEIIENDDLLNAGKKSIQVADATGKLVQFTPPSVAKLSEVTNQIATGETILSGFDVPKEFKAPAIPTRLTCDPDGIQFYDGQLATIFDYIEIDATASQSLKIPVGKYKVRYINKVNHKAAAAFMIEIDKKYITNPIFENKDAQKLTSPCDRWVFSLPTSIPDFYKQLGMRYSGLDRLGNKFSVELKFEPCKVVKAELNGVEIKIGIKNFTTELPMSCPKEESAKSALVCNPKNIDYYDEELATIFDYVQINSDASKKLNIPLGKYKTRAFRKSYQLAKFIDSGALVIEFEKNYSYIYTLGTPSAKGLPLPCDKWVFSMPTSLSGYYNQSGLLTSSMDSIGNVFTAKVNFDPCQVVTAELNGVEVQLGIKSFTTDAPISCPKI
jgi:hypothetical protein